MVQCSAVSRSQPRHDYRDVFVNIRLEAVATSELQFCGEIRREAGAPGKISGSCMAFRCTNLVRELRKEKVEECKPHGLMLSLWSHVRANHRLCVEAYSCRSCVSCQNRPSGYASTFSGTPFKSPFIADAASRTTSSCGPPSSSSGSSS